MLDAKKSAGRIIKGPPILRVIATNVVVHVQDERIAVQM